MNRFFHSAHGAARAYLFSKLFLLMLALDTWMLMIGHAGRYGMTGFNVAHFEWLDSIQPVPSAGFYIGVLLLVGLLSLVLAFSGLHRTALFALFVLYSYSWSMSMLDSFQHHYFMSLVLLCLVFFPQTSALEIHPRSPPASNVHKRATQTNAERNGWIYAGVVATLCAASLLAVALPAEAPRWLRFLRVVGDHPWAVVIIVAIATALYRPRGPGGRHMHHGWGFSLLGATVGVLYTFTAIAKMDAQWYAGDTILAISRVEDLFGWLADYAQRWGVERQQFWGWFATAVIPQELFIAVAYLVAVHQDRIPHWLPKALCLLGFASAIVLHVGAESMGLEIGWFSYYMIVLAISFLLPLPVVDRLATVFTWPARAIQHVFSEWDEEQQKESAALPLLLSAGCAAMLLIIGHLLNLPGAQGACIIAALTLIALTAFRLRRGDRSRPKQWASATLLASLCMLLAISLSPVRYDFYRYLGGDLKRRNEPEAALAAYLNAERYAPPGKSRAKQIKKLRQQLGKQ